MQNWPFKTSGFFWEGKIHDLKFCSIQWIVKPSFSWNSNLGWFVSRSWIFFSFSNMLSQRGKEKRASLFLYFAFSVSFPKLLARHFHVATSSKNMNSLPPPWKWTLLSKLSVFEDATNFLGLKTQNLRLTFDSFPSSLTKSYCASLFLVLSTLGPVYFSKTVSDVFLYISKSSLPLTELAHSQHTTMLPSSATSDTANWSWRYFLLTPSYNLRIFLTLVER